MRVDETRNEALTTATPPSPPSHGNEAPGSSSRSSPTAAILPASTSRAPDSHLRISPCRGPTEGAPQSTGVAILAFRKSVKDIPATAGRSPAGPRKPAHPWDTGAASRTSAAPRHQAVYLRLNDMRCGSGRLRAHDLQDLVQGGDAVVSEVHAHLHHAARRASPLPRPSRWEALLPKS